MNPERQNFPQRIAALTDVNLLPTNNLREIRIEPHDLEKLNNLTLPVIFVTTHLSHWDTTAFINALAKQTTIDVSIAHDSSHDEFLKDPFTWLSFVIAKMMTGKENFLPITYRKKKGVFKGVFRLADYEPQVEIIKKEQRSIIMAGYYSDKNNRQTGVKHVGFNQYGATLPPKGGVGAVFLSILSNTPMVPVAVNVESHTLLDSFVGRPGVSIKIGDPILPKVESNFNNWTAMNVEEKKLAIKELRHYSDMILESQAAMLPAEKRGSRSAK